MFLQALENVKGKNTAVTCPQEEFSLQVTSLTVQGQVYLLSRLYLYITALRTADEFIKEFSTVVPTSWC